MRKLLFSLLLLVSWAAHGQAYNNEWIDYSKTYYRFRVGANGLVRIPQATLTAAGLGTVPAEHFQLWRNGVEVPLFTSVPAGPLPGNGFIEFWGEMNDGRPDSLLYRNRNFQLSNRWSLLTDTATYFLTVNNGVNRRLEPTANNVAGNVLPAEPWFLHTAGNWFRNQLNPGFAVNVGDVLYSSSYDRGEGWVSPNIGTNGTNTGTLGALLPFTGANAPQPRFLVAVSGTANNPRRFRVNINGDSTIGGVVNNYTEFIDSTTFPISRIASGTASVAVTNITGSSSDRLVIHRYELRYPRLFNFGNATSFDFTLPATATGQFLQIVNFNAGATAPVLYDLTNGLRLVANTQTAGQFRFVLPPSQTPRRLIMVRGDALNALNVASLVNRTFTNLNDPAHQGDYLIISSPLLMQGPSGTNPVEEYRAYRSSTDGGGFNAKVYLAEDLIDQFAFGIKMHPMGISNFLRFARNRFGTAPRHVYLIGKGVVYNQQRTMENNPIIRQLNLVPTFGHPASDALLTANPGSSIPRMSIGRLSAIYPQEVTNYLNKVKQFEQAQRLQSPFLADKAWMKNVVHLAGSTEPQLITTLGIYLDQLSRIITDTLYGAKVTTFIKNSPNTIEQINSGLLDRLFAEGISLITYFGHSSSTNLEYNLNTPEQYNNPGKYPLFVALGCNVGNVYSANSARLNTLETLSERYTMTPDRGTIGFIAGSSFGITDYLQQFNRPFYNNLGVKNYGGAIGDIMRAAVLDMFAVVNESDFYARSTAEQTALNGDPALRINPHAKPDYVIEDPMVRVSPGFVSIADPSFQLSLQVINMGRAINRRVPVEVERTYPNGTTQVIHRDTLRGIRYLDSLSISIPIDPQRDKGLNRIRVTIDPGNNIDELQEGNNSVSKEIIIFEDEARPVYPYNYAIVNRQNIKLMASTANPLIGARTYRMEIDTTELFHSALRVTQNLASSGGLLEFTPGLTFQNNTVYYWRIAEIPASGTPTKWLLSSFLYRTASDTGFGQSHYFQHLKSARQRLRLDSASRLWQSSPARHELYIRNAVWGTATGQEGDLVVNVNGESYIRNTCNYGFIFNIFDGKSFRPWINAQPNQPGTFGSLNVCGNARRMYNFEYPNDSAGRRRARDLIRAVPDGHYIVVRNQPLNTMAGQQYAADWAADANVYGANNTLYSELRNAGFTLIDSVNRPRAFAFVFRKGSSSFLPAQAVSDDRFDVMSLTAFPEAADSVGLITSPTFGPAAAWRQLVWNGTPLEAPGTDTVHLSVIGIRANGTSDTLLRRIRPGQSNVDLSFINAATYPSLRLHMAATDTVHFTPWQLDFWRVLYTPIPEGAVAPNVLFEMKDTLDVGEPLSFKMAFRNTSDVRFDSLKVRAVITDASNVSQELQLARLRPLPGSDTVHVRIPVDTRLLVGNNTLFVDVNPNNDQPEQFRFNNFIYRNFFVRGDSLNPLLEVTFDNRRILNGDIVSAKPAIDIRLKDESRWRLLDDTSLVTVEVIDPNNLSRLYSFNSDTLRFEPATGTENQAVARFRPHFTEDGIYQLIVSGRDKSGNGAGRISYKVNFEVVNKAMISNMLNYPNPFTTSTAFVFTITGAEVPQNIRIQILTVTGRIVREITKAELGPLRVGQNITEFKWDGTDQYGQPLGNGVYLYRVITNHQGKSLERFTNKDEKTDQFFNKGYGKMYLMR